jgi:hypothetical protein
MQLPSGPKLTRLPGLNQGLHSLASLAAFVRDRLARRGDTEQAVADPGGIEPARQLDLAVVAASAPFAPTSYARARLLRQLHASGLLTRHEAEQAEQVFGVAQ